MYITQIKTVSFFLIFLFCCGLSLSAQPVIRENIHGEQIKVYPDGRIEYFNGDPYVPQDGENLQYPVFQGYIEPLDGEITVNQADLFKIAQRRSQLSVIAEDLAQQRLTEAEENLQRLEQRSKDVQANPEQVAIVDKQLAAARRTLDQSRRQLNESQLAAQADEDLVKKGGFVELFNQRRRNNQQNDDRSDRIKAASGQSYVQIIPLADNTAASSFEDLMVRPPRQRCSFAFEGQDAEVGTFRRDLESELLFTYTDERLRPYLQDKEYLSCEAYLSSVGGYRFLTLDFTFAYPNAQEAYGFIDQNSVLTLKLLNGDAINLRAASLDRGQYDTVKNELTYSVYYSVDRSYIGLLKASELDLIRVFWSSGFEEYPIHQMDFFQRQFQCLGD
ncbi:MAG: hypothetical protein AAFR36_10575 [Bacteroidota bacterium]